MSKKRALTDYYQPQSAKRRKLMQDLQTSKDKGNDNSNTNSTETKSLSVRPSDNDTVSSSDSEDDIPIGQRLQKNKDTDDIKNNINYMDVSKLKGLEFNWEDNATVLYYDKFLDKTRSKQLFDELMKLKYEQGEFKIFGKTVKTPRLQSWMRDNDISNKNANLYQSQDGYPWSKNVLYVKNSIEKLINCKFNYVLINYYRDGKDYIAWHSDKEAIPSCKNIVGSVSLGGTRRFCFRHKQWKEKKIAKHEFKLTDGCLVVMKDDTQKQWKHTVPKSKKPQKPRINLTFRQSCVCPKCSK